MFKNRYWREYPWGMQFLLFVLMIFTLTSFFTVVAYLVVPFFTGVPIAEVAGLNEQSSGRIKDAFLLLQGISSIGVFLAPALLFAYLAHPRPGEYLGLRKPGKAIHWVLVPLVMLGAMPLLLGLESLMREINLAGKAKEMQNTTDTAMKALLTMHSPADFVKSFIVMSIIPAISEEFLFRGAVMRIIHSRNKRTGVAIAVSALTFAVVHYNPVGLFAIFFAAVLLGGIYYLTGSLWLSILAHFLNNGLQIVMMYLGTKNAAIKAFVDGDSIPLWLIGAGAALFAGSFYLLWKNSTPLPDDWSDDFKGEERPEHKAGNEERADGDEPEQLF
ncbi:CPBP family intramembrane glutamic endopeptidase [Polluticoccus soli]|uniref:CPBP family intramembrane glutamic endopeptidase n=1 Tax=Polluticoccus soli TaxID=3034150 RepID=UPI0023E0B8DE|nr:CPBP family intramembrane glutamic endopeptidase [Flavipsychrobacter sp. JY13-12]